MRRSFDASLIAACLVFASTPIAAMADDHFEQHIRPVLVDTCFRCHGDTKTSGALRVDSRDALIQGGESGPAIVPSKPEESLLIKAIQRHDDVSAMPPEKEKSLRPDQIAAFEQWIRDGANWPESTKKFESKQHWAFEPIANPPLPNVKEAAWVQTSVDAFIRARQEAAKVSPAAAADKLTLLRRATFDLTGLPPTPEAVAEFLADHSPDAFAKVVDRLLASPHYGERWGRHWLDVVRYADTAGETADYPVPLAWKYRNYVIDSFNADKPYDQFLREQIAGDVLANQNPTDRYAEQVTATGYLAISRRFGFDSENYHHLTIQDTIDTLGQSAMGLSIGCSRCHDHKFDAITMTDYYGLYGIFDSSRYAFPGSEQKQKFRSMVPLLPPSEAVPKWRDFDRQVATVAASLEARNQPVTPAILRSLNDLDGDFEMQAPAAGGSNGVLVPPWLYQGKIAVTNAAQSPFRNLYARGRVGASIASDAGAYRIAQSLYPHRDSSTCDAVYVNLDFRMAGDANPSSAGIHRIWIGGFPLNSLAELHVSTSDVTLNSGDSTTSIGAVRRGEWQNVQLVIDLKARRVSGSVASASDVSSSGERQGVSRPSFSAITLMNSPTANDAINFIVIESNTTSGPAPGIEFDNLGVQDIPIPPASTTLPNRDDGPDEATLVRKLEELIGIGGEYELQTSDSPPSTPWGPGPNSVVRVATRSQSPFRNQFPTGSNGLHMPNRAEYDGFGLTLPTARRFAVEASDSTEILHACFDFRNADVTHGGDGSWRFYLGHGPGNSAAIELFFNGSQFFRRSGDARDVVTQLKVNEWYQVLMTLDLKNRRYAGIIASNGDRVDFSGDVAANWDGIVDYSFIDSYGHIGGVRPAIDVDNYDVRTTPLRAIDAPAIEESSTSPDSRIARAREIQLQLARVQKTPEQLNSLLSDGPFPMTYGMAEGTPHSVPMQLRGEPSQPGELVPRGFIKVLGGGTLDDMTPGSGRLELANWLTSPQQPLTARVMVNRIWQYHFGRGLVRTPNDFGVRGLQPSHPELLDHLATQFIRSGWSIKSMHRLMMLSHTYQQSATASTQSSDVSSSELTDLYAHFPRRRLSAEEIRDSILFVTGELDPSPGQGHPFPSPVTWGFSQHGPFSAVYDHNKRSVYLMTQRLKRHPFLALFDGPDPNASTADRLGTTVPTQALFFLNDPFVHRSADQWAERILAASSFTREQSRLALAAAYGSEPSDDDMQEAEEFLNLYAQEVIGMDARYDGTNKTVLAAYLRTVIGSNEFLHVD